MPRILVAFAALGLLGCPPPPAAAPPPPPREPPVVAKAPTPPAPMPASVGALERPAALERFFAALRRLDAKDANDDVRIVQLGDSHTAADWETGPMRRQLQARFGDGGRGFVPVGRPWKAWSQEGLLTGTAGEWLTQMNNPAARHATGDGVFGLGGVALATRQMGARAWDDVLVASSRVELAYLEQPGGGSFDFVVDGRSSRVTTRAESVRSGYVSADLSASLPHHVEVRALGDGEVRIFGAALDRTEHGVVLDALGINGARVATPLSWTEAAWQEALVHRAPSLVVVAYGTNDAADPETSLDAFESGLGALLTRVARSIPASACLVLGPHDRGNAPRLGDVIARSRRAAAAGGCAFFDRRAAMGGEGAIAKWGQPDKVHLSRSGYAEVATAFVTDLVNAYDVWRKR